MANQNNPNKPGDTGNKPTEKRDGERPMEEKSPNMPGERRDEKRDENKAR